MSTYRYCTPLDIRRILGSLGTNEIVNDETLWEFCLEAGDVVLAYLLPNYGAESALVSTPYVGTPFLVEDSKGKGRLSGGLITLATTGVTDQWEVKFSSSSVFAVTAYYGGSQGSGNISALFTSSDLKVTIPVAAWLESSKIMAGDLFKFSTYNVFRVLKKIATWLATAEFLQSAFCGEIPNSEGQSDKWQKKAEALLDKLSKEKPDLKLATFSTLNLDPIGAQIDFDEYGSDVSNYADNEME